MTGQCNEGCDTGWTGYMCDKGNFFSVFQNITFYIRITLFTSHNKVNDWNILHHLLLTYIIIYYIFFAPSLKGQAKAEIMIKTVCKIRILNGVIIK